jgi:uncharacterized Zn finger protein (UPF0148 family)
VQKPKPKCPVCEEGFADLRGLSGHIRLKHNLGEEESQEVYEKARRDFRKQQEEFDPEEFEEEDEASDRSEVEQLRNEVAQLRELVGSSSESSSPAEDQPVSREAPDFSDSGGENAEDVESDDESESSSVPVSVYALCRRLDEAERLCERLEAEYEDTKGFRMMGSVSVENSRTEKLSAMLEAARENRDGLREAFREAVDGLEGPEEAREVVA